ncbi:unnamed protein product, partial [Amoebophrya sp. A120]
CPGAGTENVILGVQQRVASSVTRGMSGRAVGFLDGSVGLMKGNYMNLESTGGIIGGGTSSSSSGGGASSSSSSHFPSSSSTSQYLNCGGARMLGFKPFRGRISDRDIAKIAQRCRELDLQGLVIVGGLEEVLAMQEIADKINNLPPELIAQAAASSSTSGAAGNNSST